jgi:transposase InsO family protein
VYYASSACPIVPVKKKGSDDQNVKIRITGNFAATYNKCAELYQYPIPKIEDLHAALRGCKVFSVLDMSQAYHQIPISAESQKYLTINTHLGLFSFTRLPNGVHSGPAIFQQIMDTVLAGVPKTICYLDDILVAGANHEEHLRNLSLVFKKLYDAGFRLHKEKCNFECSKVTYLGHVIDAEGLHPTEDKVKTIQEAQPPKDKSQLKSFLGLLMFYSRFIPFHAKLLAPLNRLLRDNVNWKWGQLEEGAFCAAKKALLNSQTLVHYDSELPLYLSCDASSYGVGAVLSHKIGGHDRPVAFASATLSKAQQNYSQLDKEAFSIIFGLKRFRQFLAAREFTIITDHRPLLQILGPTNLIQVHTAARLQRWALILASFKYKLEFRSTNLHGNADFVSRFPLAEGFMTQESPNVNCYFFEEQVMSNVTSTVIAKATSKDAVLSKVLRFVMNGWPNSVNDPLLVPFHSRKLELTVEQGCVLWGYRVLIPDELRKAVLNELHDTHPGITRMKRLARSYVWWPKLDEDIEKLVNQCNICQSMRADPPKSQVHPWVFPSRPWSRVHIDFKGPVGGKTYLVLVDAYSKFPEVVKMTSTTTTATLAVLRDIFSRQGLPEVLVSDNGPQFVSKEFQDFCSKNGIVHHTSAVHKPASNGQAERVVQILSSALKQAQLTHSNVDSVIARYLLIYRNTPHSTTGETPSMLLMGRRLRTRLDLMLPSVTKVLEPYLLVIKFKPEITGWVKNGRVV